MKILVINITRMGDILQSTPMLWGLKKKYCDNCKIHYLVGSGFLSVLDFMPYIDKKISLDIVGIIARVVAKDNQKLVENFSYFEKIINILQNEQYDLAINLTHTDESKALTYLVNAKKVIGITMDKKGTRIVKHPWENYFYASNLNRNINKINLVDIYLKFANLSNETPKKLLFKSTTNGIKNAQKLLLQNNIFGKQYFTIQLGASVGNKQYPPQKFAEIANYIFKNYNFSPVFLGTEKELELYDQTLHILDCPHVNFMGKTNIDTLGEIIKKSVFLLTNDTGTMHIASGVGTVVVCIALATAYSHETAAYSQDSIIIEADIQCTPCSHHVVCENPICKSYINPKQVLFFIENYILKSNFNNLQEDNDFFKSIKVFQTKFDSNNFLRLFPLIKREITQKEILNLCYHFIWIKTLGFEDYQYFENTTVDLKNIINDISNEIEKYYIVDSNKINKLKNLNSTFSTLSNLASEGLKSISIINELFKSNNLVELKKESPKLLNIDKKIVDYGFEFEILRPLTFMFKFGKDNLDSDDIAILFEKTYSLYKQLKFRSNLMASILEKTFQIIYTKIPTKTL